MAKTPVTIRHNPDEARLEAVLEDGRVAGFSQYRRTRDGHHNFFHTEVGDEFEGQGIGGQVARGVVDWARAEGVLIVPGCPFIRGYLRSHEDTHDVLAPGARLDPDD